MITGRGQFSVSPLAARRLAARPKTFPVRLSYILLFCHPFAPARPVYSTRLSQPGPCIPLVCPSPGPCAVQARMFLIEETQASVYTHLASNGAWKEWSYCKRRETKEIISFSEGWKSHTRILLEGPLVQWLNLTTRKPLLNQIY